MEENLLNLQNEVEQLKKYISDNQEFLAVSEKMMKNLPKYYIKITNNFYKKAILANLIDLQSYVMQNGLQNKPKKLKYYSPEKNEYKFPINAPYNNNIEAQMTYFFNVDDIKNFRTHKKWEKKNFSLFFETNPDFKYYFWNVTFPNIFGYFLSEEYLKSAKEFLDIFIDDLDIYFSGFVSFIRHNFGFQETFMNSFFKKINQIDPNEFIETWNEKYSENMVIQIDCVKEAFIAALFKLKIHQFEIFKYLLTNHQKETEKIIIKDIIIYFLQTMSRSPLFVVHSFLFKNCDNNENFVIVDELSERMKDDNFLDNFFNDIIKKGINCYIPPKSISLGDVIFWKSDILPLTILDLTIINSISQKKIQSSTISLSGSNLNEPLDTSLLFNKAFRVWWFEINLKSSFPFPLFVMEGDPNFVKRWQSYTDECARHSIDPLTSVYEGSYDLEMTHFVLYNEKRKILRLKSIDIDIKKRMAIYRPLMDYIKSLENASLPNIASYFSFLTLKNNSHSYKSIKVANMNIKRNENDDSKIYEITDEEKQFFKWIYQLFANNVSSLLLKKLKAMLISKEKYQQAKRDLKIKEKIVKTIIKNSSKMINGDDRVTFLLNHLNKIAGKYLNILETREFSHKTVKYVIEFISSLDSISSSLTSCFYNSVFSFQDILGETKSLNSKFINYSEISNVLDYLQSVDIFYYIKSFVNSQIQNGNKNENNENPIIALQISSFIQSIKTLNRFLSFMVVKDLDNILNQTGVGFLGNDNSNIISQQLFSYALEGEDDIKESIRQSFDTVSHFIDGRKDYLDYFKHQVEELNTFEHFLDLKFH